LKIHTFALAVVKVNKTTMAINTGDQKTNEIFFDMFPPFPP
jgi:hypothetical protein